MARFKNLKPDNLPLATITASGIGTQANMRLPMTHGWATKTEDVLSNGGSHLVPPGHQVQLWKGLGREGQAAVEAYTPTI